MRKQILPILVLVMALAACQPAAPTTPPPPTPSETPTITPVPPTETPTLTPTASATPLLNSQSGPPLLSIHMFTAQRGWGVMENQLLVTNDGGFTWASVPVPGGAFSGYNGAFFKSEQEAFILVAAPDGSNTGTLNYTTDGGQSWESIPVPMASGQVQFLADTNLEGFIFQSLGVAAGSMPVAVFQTLDRIHWLRTFAHVEPAEVAGLPFVGVKTGASFINPSVGWVTGSEPVENFIYLYQTGDAGRTWQKVDLPVPTDVSDFMAETQPPVFFERSKGFMLVDFLPTAGGESKRYYYYTEDGGTNWVPRSFTPRSSAYQFLNASTGWTWVDRQLYSTVDGAATWTSVPTSFPSREAVTCIDFIDPNNGWLVTVDDRSRVRLYRTADAGSTWSVIIP